MIKFIIQRLWTAIPVLFLVTIINFTIMNVAPGDPASAMINPAEIETANPEYIKILRQDAGLDDPIPVRYIKWLRNLMRGNLGYSLVFKSSIAETIVERLPRTLQLSVTALLISMTLGVVFGVVAALRQYSKLDYAFTAFAFAGISIPAFFAALFGLYVFALKLQWVPSYGVSSYNPSNVLLDRLHHMILPAAILSIEGIAGWLRLTRTTMLEVMHQEYILTARAKGLNERVVIIKHALRSTLIPLVTSVGLHLPGLLGGSVLIETVFAWPGMGLLGITAIYQRDYPVLMATNLMFAIMIMAANILTDIMYAVVDPRVRLK